jgi:periplasmic protein TonB
MPSHRLLFALSLSVSLHLMAFGTVDLLCRMQKRHPPRPPAMLDATLRIPVPDMVAEPLLKNTLAQTEPRAKPKPPKDVKPGIGRRIAEAVAKKKLAKHVYYPEAAIAAGIEGQVRLLLTLNASGGVKDVQIAESSGHAILDQAAIRAAYAMGSLPGLTEHEIILPVTFRLQP